MDSSEKWSSSGVSPWSWLKTGPNSLVGGNMHRGLHDTTCHRRLSQQMFVVPQGHGRSTITNKGQGVTIIYAVVAAMQRRKCGVPSSEGKITTLTRHCQLC